MEKPIKPGRVTALACILMLLVIVFVVALYKLQIVDGKAYYEENRNSVASSQTVEAARGSILDRYGHVLVSNTSCNNLVFNPDDLFEQDDPNGILLQMARTVAACGDTYVDELPVTAKPPVRVHGHERHAAHPAQGLPQIRRPRRGGHGRGAHELLPRKV